MIPGAILAPILITLAIVTGIVLLVFVLVPLVKGLVWLIGSFFRAIGWLIMHVLEFVGGTIGDVLRLVGAVIAAVVLMPLALLSVVIGRWSAATHYADSVKRELGVAGRCIYRAGLHRPLKLFWLHGLLEGVEQRVPAAMAAAPTADRPSRRTGTFEGYTIVGSLRAGGSGAKLYIAEPAPEIRSRLAGRPDRVVIKAFALAEGSTLPQIVRESRALECAKRLGHVLEHGMDAQRFWYVMPYHPGEHLGTVGRELHGRTDGSGLGVRELAEALRYECDLVRTLDAYHREGLWHKDVKPENLIVHDGRAHLVDLGLVTPLRSAMTLTTHGTEYFRDPEMVRQALRGVKVHEVDGAKFDVFAAGAVLYYLLENEFPAHGALSRFGKRSPEALKWIVRRAMADYAHRYGSAAEMLGDLQAVAAAADPFTVRPADLPSVGGRGVDAAWAADEADEAAAPMPLHAAAAASVATPAPAAPAAAVPAGRARPGLEVVNWWTGAYRHAGPASPEANAAQASWRDWRRQAKQTARSARAAAHDARRAARRSAARLAPAERAPTGFLAVLVVAFVALVGAIFAVNERRVASSSGEAVAIAGPESGAVVLGEGLRISGGEDGRPLLVVPIDFDAGEAEAQSRLARIVAAHARDGYAVSTELAAAQAELDDARTQLVEAYRRWSKDHDEAADAMLEDFMERQGVYGLLFVQRDERTGRLRDSLVWSTRPGAEQRRRVEIAAPVMPNEAYLVVNDHPARHAPEVTAAVERIVAQLRARGAQIVEDDEAEASVRKYLVDRGLPGREHVDAQLRSVIAAHELAGIVHVRVADGEGAPAERISIELIRGDAAPADAESRATVPVIRRAA